jgi:hypothetical protein
MEETNGEQEFRNMLEASGLVPGRGRPAVGDDPSALNQIVRENSPVKPSAVTLRFLKLLLVETYSHGQRMSKGGGDHWHK